MCTEVKILRMCGFSLQYRKTAVQVGKKATRIRACICTFGGTLKCICEFLSLFSDNNKPETGAVSDFVQARNQSRRQQATES